MWISECEELIWNPICAGISGGTDLLYCDQKEINGRCREFNNAITLDPDNRTDKSPEECVYCPVSVFRFKNMLWGLSRLRKNPFHSENYFCGEVHRTTHRHELVVHEFKGNRWLWVWCTHVQSHLAGSSISPCWARLCGSVKMML